MPTDRKRPLWRVSLAAVLLVTGCARPQPIIDTDEPRGRDEPPRPTSTAPPPVRSEPPLPPGQAAVVVHDCDRGGGYRVNQWSRSAPLPAGSPEAHLIAVYQTSSDHSFRHHPTGAADVYVHRTARPQVLVFSAYEPVVWRVHAGPGVRISRVVLYGYHRQQVTGVPRDAEVVDRVGHGRPSGGTEPDETVAAAAGAPIVSSTYCYDAATFSLRA